MNSIIGGNGDLIKVRGYNGVILEKRIVEVLYPFRRIHVCREEEYFAAIKENRQPKYVGFDFADIVFN